MERIKQFIKRVPGRVSDRGASLVEYALVVALIAVVCVGAVTKLGSATSDSTTDSANSMGTPEPSGTCHPGEHVGTGDSSHGAAEAVGTCYIDGPHIAIHAVIPA